MARPLRIEFAGALYHITSRGNARNAIYSTDGDQQQFLTLLQNPIQRYDWYCHAYCLMDNHYHLLIETNSPTLSKGMKYLNGTYTQYFNRQHHRVGHVFQGRFKAILVEKDSYLLELARYIVLNPVRAQLVRSANHWPWSSYRATISQASPLRCLQVDWLLSQFGSNREQAIMRYQNFVRAGIGLPPVWEKLKNQIFLGERVFVERLQSQILAESRDLKEIPKAQRRAIDKPLSYYVETFHNAKEGMNKAYASGGYTMQQIADAFGVHYSTVSRAIKKPK